MTQGELPFEPNIFAGIKYMRYIVDTHIDDPGIDPVNRLLFAFASYNQVNKLTFCSLFG